MDKQNVYYVIYEILSENKDSWCKRVKEMERLNFQNKYPVALDRARTECLKYSIIQKCFRKHFKEYAKEK